MKIRNLMSFIFTALLSINTSVSFGQPKAVGSEIGDISFTDIYGEKFTLYEYLDQGYTVFIDVSATWCPPCWDFHQTGVMQDLYTKYGPKGTVDAGKILPIFIEGDVRTNRNDLMGTGNSTLGDWLTGKDYPIVEVINNQELFSFFSSGSSVSFPTFFMICPDKKIKFLQEGFRQDMTTSNLFKTAEGCEPVSTTVSELAGKVVFDFYPNPVSDELNIFFNGNHEGAAILRISTLSGQEVYNEPIIVTTSGSNTIDMRLFVSGMYLISIDNGKGLHLRKKVVKR